MAMIVSDVILTLARERATDGMVALADLERVTALIQGGGMVLDAAYMRQEETCRKFHLLPRGNVGARSNPFQRLMVRPFEHLLAGEDTVLPRAYLPHYFEFLERALGKGQEDFERRCRSIVQALMVVHGNSLTWDQFYADSRTVQTLHDALKLIMDYLGGPEGQQIWLACMMRPSADLPQPSLPQVTRIRQVLRETAKGLEAAE
jgi:hypothetical protein